MSLKIRLSRGGAKKRPFYRLVVTNSRSPRDSKFIEKLGTFNPLAEKGDEKRFVLETDRITHWLKMGAVPSEAVARQLRKLGLLSTKPTYTVKAKGTGLKTKAAAALAKANEAAAAPAEAPAAEAAHPAA